ncbi:hypothetical protein DEI93_12490 [Curtobacterium sp. MCBD17_035]|uniref:hypothetical protein n=1 Tax=Curtobacterium sp. MCBD17_035 TaxID=2175673 RepID=UPI000DAAD447|nr:hypothetical protein [Curtobacterium sp. MCBD17_035]WIB66774.1 hypothetical protein DEI93_12490 [Curtobacterium sp. MCBD17_035]
MPGAAARIAEAHLRREAVDADALERLSAAEATAVLIGAFGAQALTLGGLGAAVVLIAAGDPGWACTVGVPAVLGGAAQLAAAIRRSADGDH